MLRTLAVVLVGCVAGIGAARSATTPSRLEAITTAAWGNLQEHHQCADRAAGELIFEQYFDDGGPEALRNTRSATKTITGMLVGAAVDRQLLRVDSPVLPFFADRLPLASGSSKIAPHHRGLSDHELAA
jgi:CubicO group peptidase (beta-lactamase class C family)